MRLPRKKKKAFKKEYKLWIEREILKGLKDRLPLGIITHSGIQPLVYPKAVKVGQEFRITGEDFPVNICVFKHGGTPIIEEKPINWKIT